MKIIKLNESQFHRVLESNIENGTYGEEGTPEYESHEEVTTQPTITDKNGNVKKGNPTWTDRVSSELTYQQHGNIHGGNFYH